MYKIVNKSEDITYFENLTYDQAAGIIGRYSQFNNTMKLAYIVPIEAVWAEITPKPEVGSAPIVNGSWSWNSESNNQPVSKNWFVWWDETAEFQYFETEEAAIHVLAT